MSERPGNLDGGWDEKPVEGDSYSHFHAGPVEVRFDKGFEPEGELVTNGPVRVHLERMGPNEWWMGLNWGNAGKMVAVHLTSKKPIDVQWSDER